MKLLITGSRGQLGTELMRLGSSHDLLGVDQDELDITDADAVRNTVRTFAPDAVINAAAYTAVDKAESDQQAAFAVNRDGAGNLAVVCEKACIPLIHYSTDYVFDGAKQGAYTEEDRVSPLGIYGESKLAGEQAVQACCSRYVILRTSWVFSAHGNNFVKTMLRLAGEREELGVVVDQYGKPTSALELARVTLEILPHLNHQWGIYHLAQPEVTSWHGFAGTIFDVANALDMPLKIERFKAITTEEYPTPARRPINSALNCNKLEEVFGISIEPWQQSLAQVIKELKDD